MTDDRELSECFQHLPAEECYLNLPEDSATDNPLDIEAIKKQQMLTKNFSASQLNMTIDTYAKASVQSTMSCAMSSQEILQPIGE